MAIGGRGRRWLSVILVTVAADVASAPTTAQSQSVTFVDIARVYADGRVGHVGVDTPGGPAVGYDLFRYWDTTGQVDEIPVEGAPAWIRFEFYPASHAYDPWSLDLGGVHIHRDPSMGPGWLTLGDIVLPAVDRSFGGAVGFHIVGAIASTTPVPDDRVEIDAFQLDPLPGDSHIPPLPRNAAGVPLGAFATSTNRGLVWTAGVGWPGRYVLFIRDTATDRHIQAIADLAPGSVPRIDLDAVCFGFYTCQYDRGAPGPAVGAFHPVAPARVLDTRAGLGIRNGPVRTGGGWSASEIPQVRHDEVANHELKVTGRYGVPATGVSAVLLNVVAVNAPGAGYLAVRPRRPSCCSDLAIHDDRSAIDPLSPATSNLNVGPVDAVANLVLAKVGAGGTISFYNSWGPTDVVADVAGWFDVGSAEPDALGFTGVQPARLLDTRDGTGGPARPFEIGDVRTLAVSGVAGVPADAASVVVNITATQAAGAGYVTAFPSGQSPPGTSSVNFTGAVDRANLAVVPVGVDGSIALSVADASTHLVVDVIGSFSPGGGRTTTIAPVRVADSRVGHGLPGRKLATGESVPVQLGGVDPVPGGVSAVVLNVTVTQSEGPGFVTVGARDAAHPTTSNVNFAAGLDVPNLVFAPLGTDGAISVHNGGAPAHVLIDVMGYVST